MYPAAEIVALVYVGGLQEIGGLVMLPRLVLLNNFSPRHIYPCVQILYLHGGDALYINLYVGQQFYKIRVRRQFAQQRIIHLPAFQQVNHSVTQTQVCKIGVWETLHFRQTQQIVGGHAVKLCQLDKGVVADVFEVLRFIAAQRRLGKVRLLRKLL